MKYKKFFLIPVVFFFLVFFYANFINSISYYVGSARYDPEAGKSIRGEVIGIGQAVSVQVTRATKPYLFGLVDLPGYAQGIGNLTIWHTAFFWSLYALMGILTAIFIIIERGSLNMVKPQWDKSASGNKTIWVRLGKAVGIGALFALAAFLISGDTSSLPLGLLVAYLEFRMSQ